ncbi:hypothetical protein HDU96_009497 [Phlyctochytrium bullatum]|nr:hypothetical protein HDU96_009497 [Phlyctochytrium bullatum]
MTPSFAPETGPIADNDVSTARVLPYDPESSNVSLVNATYDEPHSLNPQRQDFTPEFEEYPLEDNVQAGNDVNTAGSSEDEMESSSDQENEEEPRNVSEPPFAEEEQKPIEILEIERALDDMFKSLEM